MSDPSAQTAYHLLIEPQEISIASRSLRLLIIDEAHEPQIRDLARSILQRLRAPAGDHGQPILIALTAPELKIAHTAFKLALDDTRRDQGSERTTLRTLLERMPDEHALRAIALR